MNKVKIQLTKKVVLTAIAITVSTVAFINSTDANAFGPECHFVYDAFGNIIEQICK